jgi:adenosine deaminase CECR1
MRSPALQALVSFLSRRKSGSMRKLMRGPSLPVHGENMALALACVVDSDTVEPQHESADDYEKERSALIARDRAHAFDAAAIAGASKDELAAAAIVAAIRTEEREGGTGDHFLGNVDRINRSRLMRVAKEMPKGAHLHCHYNTCLHPSFLIKLARGVRTMFIRSTIPLLSPADFGRAEISFSVRPASASAANLFDAAYGSLDWMSYAAFLDTFPTQMVSGQGAEAWLASKTRITERDAHGIHQTAEGHVDMPIDATSHITDPVFAAYGTDSISARA